MAKTMISAQLYNIREFMKTPEDIAKSLKKVKEIGYGAVELSGNGLIKDKEMKKLCDDNGLSISSVHFGFEQIQNEPDKVIDQHSIWGTKHVAIGGLPGQYHGEGAEGYAKFAKIASIAIKKLADAGFDFSYHNHSFELEKFGDRTGLQILYEESDPNLFNSQLDTYWVQHGGGDPAVWIKKLKGRAYLVHFKDMAIKGGQQRFAEVGAGNLNWPAILDACKEAGTEWMIVEQDLCYESDPFDSLAISLRNIKSWGIS
jgi:sugar phosphate isomerase/epimerase